MMMLMMMMMTDTRWESQDWGQRASGPAGQRVTRVTRVARVTRVTWKGRDRAVVRKVAQLCSTKFSVQWWQ